MRMEGIYEISSSEKVKRLEDELSKELKELQNNIEENDFLKTTSQSQKSFSSIPIPKDVQHFKIERKIALTNALQVRESRGLQSQADIMTAEMHICNKVEYTNKSLPLLLHQFFVDRIEELVHCKHMHMLRWARFCEHTKTIEMLYPVYQERLSLIMSEYEDALDRARRLALAREATMSGSESAMNVVMLDDLLIYTRFLICKLHSVKKIHAFLKIIEWLPYSHPNVVQPSKPAEAVDNKTIASYKARRRYSKVMSQVSVAMQLNLLRPTAENTLPNPPPISLSSYQLVSSTHSSVAASAAASGGGLASDEVNLKMPVHQPLLEKIKPMLEFLINCYAIEMDIHQVNTFADEMELFTLVSRKFKKVYSKQEQMRNFPVYDALVEDISDNKIRSQGFYCTFKKESNWTKFLHTRAEKNLDQVKIMTKLRQQNNIDELLKSHATFLHMQNSQQVLSSLREHAKTVVEPCVAHPVSVTTHKTTNDTTAVWQKIFSYSLPTSRDELLDFDAKITDENNGQKDGNFEIGSAVDMLGINDEDSKSKMVVQSAYMSFLLLRHLRLRDLQRTTLSILNYFRSIERTLTINDGGLSYEHGKQEPKKRKVFHSAGVQGLASHQYLHNTPADFVVQHSEFMAFSHVENHDDFYTFEEGRVHVQDQRGFYIMYDTALQDFKNLEKDLLLVATQFIEKDKEFRTSTNTKNNPHFKFNDVSDINIAAYGHQNVDRFGVLLDLWSNETIYMENKRQLLDSYYEAYQHTFNPREKQKLTQVMINILDQRPRFDLKEPYFVKLYRNENICLRLHCNLVKSILDKQIAEQREYVQKVTRGGNTDFGLPYRIIPKQSIAVNTSRPCLKYVYMFEFHPSLSLASAIPKAIEHALKEYVNTSNPDGFMEIINVEKSVLEVIQKEWDNMNEIGHLYSQQTHKDLFAEVFIEDPLFICEVGQSQLSSLESKSGGRRSVKERQQSLIKTWCHLLEVVTLRHRLVTTAQETEVLTTIYKGKTKEFGFDEHHIYLRAVSFDFAQLKPEAELHRIPIESILEDDGRVDRYTPGSLPLAIQELDEKHVGSFNFRTRDGVMQLISNVGIEKLQIILTSQIVHKNLLIAALALSRECLKSLNREKTTPGSTVRKNVPASTGLQMMSSMDGDLDSSNSSGTITPNATTTTSYNPQLKRERNSIAKAAFVSVQLEKTWLRSIMLNEYVHKKTTMSTVLKNADEALKIKKKLILGFCQGLQISVSEYSMRAQIIAYYTSLLQLMAHFPTTRKTHFMIGEEQEDRCEEEEKVVDELPRFIPRPRTLLSNNGEQLLNLWFIPHYTEILTMFSKLPRETRVKCLNVILIIVSSLHDICQYLCAHARLGSSHARLGSQKLEFSGVTADWGGTEGIGAELREIQKQINHLNNPTDPRHVAEFLRHRRDVMYLEFDLSISHCVPDTFLQTGNEIACQSIMENMEFALQNISNLPRPSIYNCSLSIPEPFNILKNHNLVPWRAFLSKNGPFPLQYWPWYDIGTNMQLCLAGLKDVDRHVVNGEILGVSLQLEDVLQHGLPHDMVTRKDDVETVTSPTLSGNDHGSCSNGQNGSVLSLHIPHGQQSFRNDPLSSVKLLLLFLLSWSRLEILKHEWGCRKFGVTKLTTTTKIYKAFCKAFKIEVLQPVYQHIALKKGVIDDYLSVTSVSDEEPLATPPATTDMELKLRQLIRMLENFECAMINDVIKKITREQTLVLSERSRDDTLLPTDLWKKQVMKESTTIEKPRLVENFVQNLMSDDQYMHNEQDNIVSFSKTHFNDCLVRLASETMIRERTCFGSYSMYYENLLRHQHQLLYTKEQEIKQLQSILNENKNEDRVDIHCQLADRSHELLLEITALRAKITEMQKEITNKEEEIRECFVKDYNNLVRDLFLRSFNMRNKFEEFRGFLYDDVLENLSDVRRQAMENMRKIKERSGTLKDDSESNIHFERAERIRKYQEENKNLGILFYKVKSLNAWKNNCSNSNHFQTVTMLREEADQAKKECLEIKKIYEEKEILLKQERTALRKALSRIEKEAESLKQKLCHEQKAKLQKTHTKIQEARNMKQLEMAKSTNIDKLIYDLEERETQLRSLSENLIRDKKKNFLAAEHSRRAKKQVLQQLEHERSLKLGAFERVEELQKQVYDYEQVYELPLQVRPHTTVPPRRKSSSNSMTRTRCKTFHY